MQKSTKQMLCAISLVVLFSLLLTYLNLPVSSSATNKAAQQNGTTESVSNQAATSAADRRQWGNLPLYFEPNVGQFDAAVHYVARGSGYSLFLTPSEAVLSLAPTTANKSVDLQASTNSTSEGALLRYRWQGANSTPTFAAAQPLLGKSNYFIGNDPTGWYTDVQHYASVSYKNLYPGIDVLYYANAEGKLEHDYVVAAGADPRQIRFSVEEADRLEVRSGTLVLHTAVGEVRQAVPQIYQETSSGRQLVTGGYKLLSDGSVGFEVVAYNPALALVIDPVLEFSSYLGGVSSGTDHVLALDVDRNGDVVLTGGTYALDFPVVSPLQAKNSGASDVFVIRLSGSGKGILYSTYLGGSSFDEGKSIKVDREGNIYVAGTTTSVNFPAKYLLPSNGQRSENNAFVTKINPDGSQVVYSVLLGEVATVRGLALAADRSVYVVGATTSEQYPTLNAVQAQRSAQDNPCSSSNSDLFVSKLNPSGSAFTYSTYLGGSGDEDAGGIAVGLDGSAYVSGYIVPISPVPCDPRGPLQPLDQHTSQVNTSVEGYKPQQNRFKDDLSDVFIVKLPAAGSSITYLTYLSSFNKTSRSPIYSDNGGFVAGIGVDQAGNAYIAGSTYSPDYPTVNALQPKISVAPDAFLSKLNAQGSELMYSTYLGGKGIDEAYAVAVDQQGNAYLAGLTNSPDFPSVDAVQKSVVDPAAFVTSFSSDGSSLRYSTALGGKGLDAANSIAVNTDGSVYIAGETHSEDFPLRNPVQTNPRQGFVAKLSSPSGSSRFFVETGQSLSGKFLNYWLSHGGLSIQGYPLTGELEEVSAIDGKRYRVQYFERAIFELHPENATPYDVLLSQLGRLRYNQRYPTGAPGQQASRDNPRSFAATGKVGGGRFRSYWEANGGLAQFGLPLSDEFQERSELDGKTYLVQYYERAVFEYHPENAGSKDEVLLSQLGTFTYRKQTPLTYLSTN